MGGATGREGGVRAGRGRQERAMGWMQTPKRDHWEGPINNIPVKFQAKRTKGRQRTPRPRHEKSTRLQQQQQWERKRQAFNCPRELRKQVYVKAVGRKRDPERKRQGENFGKVKWMEKSLDTSANVRRWGEKRRRKAIQKEKTNPIRFLGEVSGPLAENVAAKARGPPIPKSIRNKPINKQISHTTGFFVEIGKRNETL